LCTVFFEIRIELWESNTGSIWCLVVITRYFLDPGELGFFLGLVFTPFFPLTSLVFLFGRIKGCFRSYIEFSDFLPGIFSFPGLEPLGRKRFNSFLPWVFPFGSYDYFPFERDLG